MVVLSCFPQGLLFSAAYARLAGPRSPGDWLDSPLELDLPSPFRSVGVVSACYAGCMWAPGT